MDFWKYISGMLDLELTGADIASSFEALSRAGISLYGVCQQDDLTARLSVRRKDYGIITALAEKRGDKITVLSRRGGYWLARRLMMRPMLTTGLLLILLMSVVLPTRVLFVRVEGNSSVPTRKIIAAAESCGIRFATSRRAVRSEQVKNALLEAVPELQWAGVNTAGCVAIISVRERTPEEQTERFAPVASIVASRDGVIVSVTATSGTPLCLPGQAVSAGEILISGYTDCGICIRSGRAEGEVFARTGRDISAIMPSTYGAVSEKKLAGRKISLLIGKKRINLWKDSGISEGSCGRMYEEYYITLPGGFVLPAAVCVDTYHTLKIIPSEYPPEDAPRSLEIFARQYLLQQMTAGTILQSSMTFSEETGIFRLEGRCLCTEMIGRVRQEQIGEIHGKDS